MYYKLPEETRNQYESLMSEFHEALLPPDYQDYIDNEKSDFNPDDTF